MPPKGKGKPADDRNQSRIDDYFAQKRRDGKSEEKPKDRKNHENPNDERKSQKMEKSTILTRSISEPRYGKNYLFYSGQIPSAPSGDFIDNIHKDWFGDYHVLEGHHGFIQWLFPVFESNGMNTRSEKLSKEDAKMIREDLKCAQRVIKSYRLMLNFYGIRLVDEETGKVEREDNWREQYRNLNFSAHNFLRITRILLSLGELGFSRYKAPLVEHFATEINKNGVLSKAKRALTDFWAFTLDVEDPKYIKKTKESPEDRAESIFFKSKPKKVQNSNDEDEEKKPEVKSLGQSVEMVDVIESDEEKFADEEQFADEEKFGDEMESSESEQLL